MLILCVTHYVSDTLTFFFLSYRFFWCISVMLVVHVLCITWCLNIIPLFSTVYNVLCVQRYCCSCLRAYYVVNERLSILYASSIITSSFTCLFIVLCACRTVVWSLFPKYLPISGRLCWVSCLDRYIAS